MTIYLTFKPEKVTCRVGFKEWTPPTLKSSDYIFAPIASILLNELFIMNLSFKGSVLSLYRSIRIEVRHQNVLSV